MFRRSLLTALAITCTFTHEAIQANSQGTAKHIDHIKDLICVLVLSGVEKEDLDLNTLKKLRQHNVDIEVFNNETIRHDCITNSKLDKSSDSTSDQKKLHNASPTENNLQNNNTQTKDSSLNVDNIMKFLKNKPNNKSKQGHNDVKNYMMQLIKRNTEYEAKALTTEPLVQSENMATDSGLNEGNVIKFWQSFNRFQEYHDNSKVLSKILTDAKATKIISNISRENNHLNNREQQNTKNAERNLLENKIQVEMLTKLLAEQYKDNQQKLDVSTSTQSSYLHSGEILRQLNFFQNKKSKYSDDDQSEPKLNENNLRQKLIRPLNARDESLSKQFSKLDSNKAHSMETKKYFTSKETVNNIPNYSSTPYDSYENYRNHLNGKTPQNETYKQLKNWPPSMFQEFEGRGNTVYFKDRDVPTFYVNTLKNQSNNENLNKISPEMLKNIVDEVKKIVLIDLKQEIPLKTSTTTVQTVTTKTPDQTKQDIINEVKNIILNDLNRDITKPTSTTTIKTVTAHINDRKAEKDDIVNEVKSLILHNFKKSNNPVQNASTENLVKSTTSTVIDASFEKFMQLFDQFKTWKETNVATTNYTLYKTQDILSQTLLATSGSKNNAQFNPYAGPALPQLPPIMSKTYPIGDLSKSLAFNNNKIVGISRSNNIPNENQSNLQFFSKTSSEQDFANNQITSNQQSIAKINTNILNQQNLPIPHNIPNQQNMLNPPNIPHQQSMPNPPNIPNQQNMPNPLNIPNQQSMPNPSNIPNQQSMPNAHNMPNQQSMSNPPNIPNQQNMPNPPNIPNQQSMPNPSNIPNQQNMLNPLNIPNQQSRPNPPNIPNQQSMSNTPNIPNQQNMPNPLNIPNQQRMPNPPNIPNQQNMPNSHGIQHQLNILNQQSISSPLNIQSRSNMPITPQSYQQEILNPQNIPYLQEMPNSLNIPNSYNTRQQILRNSFNIPNPQNIPNQLNMANSQGLLDYMNTGNSLNIPGPLNKVSVLDPYVSRSSDRNRQIKKSMPPRTIQTNSNEIPPLSIPIHVSGGPGAYKKLIQNQVIIVTTKVPFWDDDSILHRKKTNNRKNSRKNYYENKYDLDNPKSYNKEKTHSSYRNRPPFSHRDFEDAYANKDEFQHTIPRNHKYNANDYERKQYKPDRSNIGYQRPSKRYRDRIRQNVDELYDTWSRNSSRERYRNRSRDEKRKSRLEVPERHQISMKPQSRYDDTHFNNFIKTQQKVNAMLERILATRPKANYSIEILK